MPKILISTSSYKLDENTALATLKDHGFELILNPYGRKLKKEEVTLLLTSDVIGMIAGVEPLDRDVLSSAKGLRVISRCGTGLDTVDLQAARDLGIDVRNTPDAPTRSVAELTIGLMLSVLRGIPAADRAIRRNEWKAVPGGLLETQTVGIVGWGRVGSRVARLCAAFGARVIGADPFIEAGSSGEWPIIPLERLLGEATIVSLHASVSPGQPPIVNAAALDAMRPGAILINTARGSLVDEAALVRALDQGKLAGVGLDVFREEPYTGPLSQRNDVVLTAHMGSAAKETRIAMEQEAACNLLDGLVQAGALHIEAM